MADRYPLVYNPSANQLQELQSGDSLDAGGTLVKNATGYATTTGTSSQFLKADGSSDSNTYLTSAGTVALAQGLTGSPSITVSAVSGTTGTFSGDVSAVNVSASSSVTAATFYGDGSSLTGIDASALKDGSNIKVQATNTGATVTGNVAATGDVSAVNGTFSGNLTVNGTTTTIDTAVTAVDSLQIDGSVAIGTDTGETNFLTTINGDLSLGEKNGVDNTFIDQKQNGSLEIINSGRTANSGSVRINRYNNISGDTTYFRDFVVYDGKETALLTVDGSTSNIGIGTTNPTRKLHLHSGITDTAMLIESTDADAQINFKDVNSGDGVSIGVRGDDFYIRTGLSTERLRVNNTGHILPGADNTQDLGSSSKRFANIYTGDLNLSNEGSANDVDGTWGQYTIQEGENDLFLINRRTGKKYKFNLTEVN